MSEYRIREMGITERITDEHGQAIEYPMQKVDGPFPITAADITDSTNFGRQLLNARTPADARKLLGIPEPSRWRTWLARRKGGRK